MKTVHGHMNLQRADDDGGNPSGVPLRASSPLAYGAERSVWKLTFSAAISAGRPPFVAAEYAMEGVLCWRDAIKKSAS